jgi:carboxyl-terminal processing protease
VDRLRGKPQTKVAITIMRPGWQEAKRLHLTREVIQVETVPQAHLLDGNVGYVKLSQFSANTTRDLTAEIRRQLDGAGGKLDGLVLDLRGNPGGLLEQAIQVSDVFLSEGVIVKTVGGGDKQRINEVKEASAESTDFTRLPLVVIVNNSSASASEIVAGALKNNGRALVVGRQTFGKGSVQVLHDFNEPGRQSEEAALKLTIAQYLTPGDVSIQEVGITPDVLLLPGRALREQVNYFAPPRSMGEADLDAHFSNPAGGPGAALPAQGKEKKRRIEKAPLELRYLLDEKEDEVAKALKKEGKEDAAGPASAHAGMDLTPEQQEDEEAEADPDRFVEDYQIRFARELLKRAPYADRARMLEGAKALVAQRHQEEEARLAKKLGELGVDWSGGPVSGAPRAAVQVTPPPGKDFRAGDTVQWTVTVENKGDAPFRRLRAWTQAEKNPLLDRREFVFGTIRPGERRSWTIPVRIPKGTDSRRDEVTVKFEDDAGKAPPELATSFGVVEVAKPVFAFSVQLDDKAGGNGDGLAQRGETFSVRVDVRNAGSGASSEKTYVSLKNLGDEKLFIKKGRAVIGAIKPGETRSTAMEVELRRGSKSEELPVRVQVVDERMEEFVSEKLTWPVAKDETAVVPARSLVRVDAAEAVLRAGAAPSAWPLATARRGAVLAADARVGEFWRIEWQKGRFAFVADADVKASKGPRAGSASEAWQREPPRIAISPDPMKGAPVVEGDSFRLTGTASVPPSADAAAKKLRDVFVFVNEQKVFFKVVPESATASSLDFQADLPLKPGNNVVTVFAREDEEFQTRRSVVIYRRPQAEVAQDAASTKRQAQ